MLRELLSLLGKIVILVLVLAVLGGLLVYLPFEYLLDVEMTTLENFVSEVVLTVPFVLLSNLVFVLAAVVMYMVWERGTGFNLGLKQEDKLFNFLKGILITILVMGTSFFIVWLFDFIRVSGANFNVEIAKSLGLGILVFLVIAAGEEILFRGYLQEVIGQHLSIGSAVIITSLLFTGYQFYLYPVHRVVPVISLFLFGLILAITREATFGLWAPLGINFVWNLIQGGILGFPVSGFHIVKEPVVEASVSGEHIISGGVVGLEGSVVLAGLLLIAIVCLTLEARKLQ